jgi:hypothetical protein
MLRQGKKTAKELNTEFLQIVRQAGMDRKTPSDHLHLIGYYRKVLEPRLSQKILFSNDVSKTIDGWVVKNASYPVENCNKFRDIVPRSNLHVPFVCHLLDGIPK